MYRVNIAIIIALVVGIAAKAQTPVLWGMASGGGELNLGVIFSYDIASGNEVVRFSFDSSSGINPNGSLIQANDGFLYGMTYAGGNFNDGTIFSFNTTTGVINVLHHFGSDSDGKSPWGSLFQASDGILYGMTRYGGSSGRGMIFSYDIATERYAHVHDFYPTTNPPADGFEPFGSIIQADNGLLYGMTSYGGKNRNGSIFSYDIATKTYHIAYNFKGTDGNMPFGSLIQANDSLLLGMTYAGGSAYSGSIFSYNIRSDSESLIHSFNNYTQGINPRGSFAKCSNGLFYGMVPYGGLDSVGIIFSYSMQTGHDTVLYNFGAFPNGNDPYGSLFQASNGLLYGTTLWGGAQDSGTIFSYNISSGVETVLHNFNSKDGYFPTGDLIEVDFPTGVSQLSSTANTFNISPNPTTGPLKITPPTTTAANYNVEITNILGQTVYKINPTNNQIDVSNLAPGIYLLKIEVNGTYQTAKFVKQ